LGFGHRGWTAFPGCAVATLGCDVKPLRGKQNLMIEEEQVLENGDRVILLSERG
jgi:hypothetical protein